jgi:hypothetical protein
LQIAAPALQFALRNSDPSRYVEVIPAFFFLLEFLSDDDAEIREQAARIVSSIIDSFIILTPIAAGETLIEEIYWQFSAAQIKSYIIKTICKPDVAANLTAAPEPGNILFEKERQNVWRDELHEFDLRLRMLLRNWTKENDSIDKDDAILKNWLKSSLSSLCSLLKDRDEVFGWSSHVDTFEAVSKVFMTLNALPVGRRDDELENTINTLKEMIRNDGANPFWVDAYPNLFSEPEDLP